MPYHFGIKLGNSKYSLNINRDEYAIIDNRSSFSKGYIYSNEQCEKMQEDALKNFDLNMKYFSQLDKDEFNNAINEFIQKENFKEVFNLTEYVGVSGYYLMVLDNFNQAYIGTSSNIKKRIHSHWNKRHSFDRLVFGGVEKSIISIDSFRVLDTTRIFALESDLTFINENKYLNSLPYKFMLNRTCGGRLENRLLEAIHNRRVRELT